jgi:hypothetical protein
VGVERRERYAWKAKVSSSGNRITTADAALFAIDIFTKNLILVLSRADHCFAEIVTKARFGLTVVEDSDGWVLPVIASMERQA